MGILSPIPHRVEDGAGGLEHLIRDCEVANLAIAVQDFEAQIQCSRSQLDKPTF